MCLKFGESLWSQHITPMICMTVFESPPPLSPCYLACAVHVHVRVRLCVCVCLHTCTGRPEVVIRFLCQWLSTLGNPPTPKALTCSHFVLFRETSQLPRIYYETLFIYHYMYIGMSYVCECRYMCAITHTWRKRIILCLSPNFPWVLGRTESSALHSKWSELCFSKTIEKSPRLLLNT